MTPASKNDVWMCCMFVCATLHFVNGSYASGIVFVFGYFLFFLRDWLKK